MASSPQAPAAATTTARNCGHGGGQRNSVRVNGSTDVLTLAPIIQNHGTGATASALTKSGAGTLILSNTANTYTGKTYINGGVLQIANADTALGTAPGSAVADQLTLNGGTLQFTGATTLAANRGITIGAAGGTFDTQANNPIISGAIAGSGAFTKTGSGKLELKAQGSLTGNVTVSQGELYFNSGNNKPALGTNGNRTITIASGATLTAGGDNPFGTGANSPFVVVNGTFKTAAYNHMNNIDMTAGTITPNITAVDGLDMRSAATVHTYAASKTSTIATKMTMATVAT